MIEDPIEILVQMAQRGDIDPWNIDIIQVTDRFFEELENAKMLNLRVLGRTFLFASTLLRIKADLLLEDEEEEDSLSETNDEDLSTDFKNGNPIAFLEHEIERRLSRKSMRKQPITLYDLISLFRNAEKEDRRRQRDSWMRDDVIFAEDIVAIAHEESYNNSFDLILEECMAEFKGETMVTLSGLVSRLKVPMPDVYISLLFLMHEGHLSIRQESFYGEIIVEPISDQIVAVDSVR